MAGNRGGEFAHNLSEGRMGGRAGLVSCVPKPFAKRAPRRRTREPRGEPYKAIHIEIDWRTVEYLDVHAFQRKVSRSALIEDICNMWLWLATDRRQEIFRAALPANTAIPEVPERWLGYLASLGFAPELDQQVVHPDVPADIAGVNDALIDPNEHPMPLPDVQSREEHVIRTQPAIEELGLPSGGMQRRA